MLSGRACRHGGPGAQTLAGPGGVAWPTTTSSPSAHRGALKKIVAGLPADLPAALLVTLHLPPHIDSRLPEILANAGPLPAAFAEDGEVLRRGRIYVAPPDLHLLADGERLLLRRGPMENGSRPAIDPMFRSVGGPSSRHQLTLGRKAWAGLAAANSGPHRLLLYLCPTPYIISRVCDCIAWLDEVIS
jgi:CheB methylesterase